jgi:hypothetical protein
VHRQAHPAPGPQDEVHGLGAGRLPSLDADAPELPANLEEAPRRRQNVRGFVRVLGFVAKGLLVGQGAVAGIDGAKPRPEDKRDRGVRQIGGRILGPRGRGGKQQQCKDGGTQHCHSPVR